MMIITMVTTPMKVTDVSEAIPMISNPKNTNHKIISRVVTVMITTRTLVKTILRMVAQTDQKDQEDHTRGATMILVTVRKISNTRIKIMIRLKDPEAIGLIHPHTRLVMTYSSTIKLRTIPKTW